MPSYRHTKTRVYRKFNCEMCGKESLWCHHGVTKAGQYVCYPCWIQAQGLPTFKPK